MEKLNLLEAESIGDLISSETEIQRRQAFMNGMSGDSLILSQGEKIN